MMAALMKRASIVIIPPVGLLSSMEDHFREGPRGPKRKKAPANILLIVSFTKAVALKKLTSLMKSRCKSLGDHLRNVGRASEDKSRWNLCPTSTKEK